MTDIAEEIPEAEPLSPQEFVSWATASPNLATELDDATIGRMAASVLDGYRLDKDSMADWFSLMERGINLASLVKDDKTYPFPKAANVKYPMITSAALQFNARAYPAIVHPDRIVKAKTFGDDQLGQKAARGDRVSQHMSWQLVSEVEEWEEETDKLLTMLPIVGTLVRKVWYDAARGRLRCRVVEPGKFIVNNKVQVLSDAPRESEELSLFPNEIRERVNAGLFLDMDYADGEDVQDDQSAHVFIEQHCDFDLDEDGYAEPYIITVHEKTQKVVRVVADFGPDDVRFDTEQMEVFEQVADPMTGVVYEMPRMVEVATGILSIARNSYYIPYHFMPSMDGGFSGTGLGLLLGDISETINSTINMLLDAGHMASLGGGFIGSDFRIKGGSQKFRPGEWKMVGSTGSAIRESLVPLTFPGPDATLFSMLGMLIDAGKEISSIKDVVTGETGGQNMTATATIALIEQGLKVFTAAYKRIFRSLRAEFKLIAKVNAETVDPATYNAFFDAQEQFDPRADYAMNDMDLIPVADPQTVTRMQEMAIAQLIMQMADQGLVDKSEAGMRVMEAASIPDREALAPKQDPMQSQLMQMQLQAAQADLAQKMADVELTLAKIDEARTDAVKNMADADATQIKSRLDVVTKALEAQRDEITGLLTRGLGRMASGHGGPHHAGMPFGVSAGAAQTGAPGVLGGQPMAGGGAVGPAPGNGAGGGPF